MLLLNVVYAAYNKISGPIPKLFQARYFSDLDLSFNKLDGRYDQLQVTSDENSSQKLLLEVNRLSGRFPSVPDSKNMRELNALRGNLFGCGNIPDGDEFSDEYSCGSEDLDVSLYVFMSASGVLVAVICALSLRGADGGFRGKDSGVEENSKESNERGLLYLFTQLRMYTVYLDACSTYTQTTQSDTVLKRGAIILTKIHTFSQELKQTMKLFMTLMCVYLVSCVPLYVLKASEYGWEHTSHTTHSYQYRWVLTSAFLRGEVSLGLVMLVWLSVLSVLSWLTVRGGVLRRWLSGSSPTSSLSFSGSLSFLSTSSKPPSIANKDDLEGGIIMNESISGSSRGLMTSLLRVLMIFSVNTCVVGSVCGGYIYFTSQSLPPSKVVGLQIGMALFNLAWNMAAVPILSRPMGAAVSVVLTELGLLILNNIVLPCIVTALTSPECFQVILL